MKLPPNKKTLNTLCREQHARMVNKGFYEQTPQIGTALMLVVAELAEAIEADRANKHAKLNDFLNQSEALDAKETNKLFRATVKDTFEDEIADAFLRLFDICGWLNIDIDAHIQAKQWFNETRATRHGKRY